MGYLIEKKKKIPKKLAEDSSRIYVSDFNKRIFGPNKIQLEPMQTDNFFVENDGEKILASYSFDKDVKNVKIYFLNPSNGSLNDGQKIQIEKDFTRFGIRHYFLCNCGRKARIFYKPEGQNLFKCRRCSNIIYESSLTNKKTMGGAFYYTDRLIKLIRKREKIKRIFYGNKLTKRAQNLYNSFIKYNIKIPGDLAALVEMQILLAADKNK